MHPKVKNILIFNFFGSILERGIPLYTDNLCSAMKYAGLRCIQFRCPANLRCLPRPLLNLLFIFCEQIMMPLLSVRFERVIYPYNSVSIIAAFSRRTLLVVHDFISREKDKKSFSAHYVALTQKFYARLGGDVAYISKSSAVTGFSKNYFPDSRTFYFPNAFYRFIEMTSAQPPMRSNEVLLCTGWGTNKDLDGALELYFRSGLYRNRPLRILGVAGRREIVDRYCRKHPELTKRIDIMPKVEDQEVVHAYETANWVWVHSQKEGYGRSIAEARFCGCRVVASDIAPFREQKDEATFLYSDLTKFNAAVTACEAYVVQCSHREPKEHDLLAAEIKRFIQKEN
jgi:glycosyltransferase involved in cell wall biosynthesis